MTQSGFDFSTSAQIVAGVDEVGRGPLVGDVVTAAVVLDPAKPIVGLNDSKKLSEAKRLTLSEEIKAKALAYAFGRASVEEIDQLNILQATMLAMVRAVENLAINVDFCRIDGNRIPKGLPCPAEAIVKGDGLVAEISAASIIAKVARDAEMIALHQAHPQYGFARNKGYGTAEHLRAITEFGILAEHRKSFAPVKDMLKAEKA
ncbi:MAG: ribonuclease HII [Reinekea sp.]|jgi:ribonuclease HII